MAHFFDKNGSSKQVVETAEELADQSSDLRIRVRRPSPSSWVKRGAFGVQQPVGEVHLFIAKKDQIYMILYGLVA